MSHITVCARFRPLSSREISDHGDKVCIQCVDSETFNFKDGKEESLCFSFDKVFYENSEQADVYDCVALPIVQDAFYGINGTIIAYGQTGAGKTYSMEGPSILECEEKKKGLLPRVVDGIFECLKSSHETLKYSINLSMVEIYMERVRDLFDLEKDNIQIKENKGQGIFLQGATEISILDRAHALENLALTELLERLVSDTIYDSKDNTIQLLASCREANRSWKLVTVELVDRMKAGKLVLVDLAGSEKAEKTGAEGKVLEEAKTINKSLSALGNVIKALTCSSPGKVNHIPYRDSKLTRILKDALGGNSRTALLCCCSPSFSNALETLSTLRFGARASHVKTSPRIKCAEDKPAKRYVAPSLYNDEMHEKILSKDRLNEEDVNLLQELFMLNGIIFGPDSLEEAESAYEDVVKQAIPTPQQENPALVLEIEELKAENKALRAAIEADKICPDFPFWFFCCFCSLLVLAQIAVIR